MAQYAYVYLNLSDSDLSYALSKGKELVLAFYTKAPKTTIRDPNLVQISLDNVPFSDLCEAMDVYVKRLAGGRTTIWNFGLASIYKKAILAEYLEWVDQVSEDDPEKTQFTPEEIVYKVVDIMEKFGYKSN